MAIKLGTQSPGLMLLTGNGDLSPIALLDTDPITPSSRAWSIFVWPDNITSAPVVTSATSNPASFTPPAAGEWYGVELVRVVGGVPQTLQALICVPDATGIYALPPPGLPADTDPTKTLVNLNSDAKIVGWSGGKRASLPGLSGAVRKAIADAATSNATIATTNAKIPQILDSAIYDFDQIAHGDGVTDDTAHWNTAIAALHAAGGGTLKLGPHSYAAGSVWDIPYDNISIEGHLGASEIFALASNTAADVITATSRTNVHLYGVTVDVNGPSRTGSPLNGPLFVTCTDSDVSWCTVKNAKGPSGFSIALAGNGVRCSAIGCRVLSTTAADGIFTSGTQNLIVGCIAEGCPDHGFVIESSQYSEISGCTALNCGAGAGISATTADCYGNAIDGLTVGGWIATVTGGVDILITGVGNLFDTRLTGITMSQPAVGANTAIYLRRTSTGNIIGARLDSITVDGATTQAIVISDGCTDIDIDGCTLSSTFTPIQLGDSTGAGIARVHIRNVTLKPGSTATAGIVIEAGADSVTCDGVHVEGDGVHTVHAVTNLGATNCAANGITASGIAGTVISGSFTSITTHAGPQAMGAGLAITSPTGADQIGVSLVRGGTGDTGFFFGAAGADGGLRHAFGSVAQGVVQVMASVRGELAIAAAFPGTPATALYWRTNGVLGTFVGIGVDPSAAAARLQVVAGSSTVAPLQIPSGAAVLGTPLNGAVEIISTGIFYTRTSTRYQLAEQYGTGVTTINVPATALTVGQTVTNTGTVTGAAVGDMVTVSPATGTAADNGTIVDAWVSSANTVTVRITCVTASITTNGTNYHVRVQRQ